MRMLWWMELPPPLYFLNPLLTLAWMQLDEFVRYLGGNKCTQWVFWEDFPSRPGRPDEAIILDRRCITWGSARHFDDAVFIVHCREAALRVKDFFPGKDGPSVLTTVRSCESRNTWTLFALVWLVCFLCLARPYPNPQPKSRLVPAKSKSILIMEPGYESVIILWN